MVCVVGDAVATGVGAVLHTAEVEPGSNVVVVGTGGVGLNVIQGARLAGAERIIAVDLLDNKLDFAREMGATHLINGGREDAVERVMALTGGRGADYAFEVIGLPKTIAQAYESVGKGGTAVVVGVVDETAELTIKPRGMQINSKKLIGCAFGSSRPQVDFPLLVDLYMDGRIKLNELITERFRLDEINEALRALATGDLRAPSSRFSRAIRDDDARLHWPATQLSVMVGNRAARNCTERARRVCCRHQTSPRTGFYARARDKSHPPLNPGPGHLC